jgi:hypothetical protein
MVRKIKPQSGKRVLNKRGPKRIFTEQDLRAVELLSKLGATNKQFAEFFKVHITSVEEWMKNYPEFSEAKNRGGINADMKVSQSLYKRAIGFKYIEEEYTAIEIDGKPVPMDQMVRVRRTKKVLPPDVKAIIHWLRIRQREIWSIVPELLHRHTGKVEHLHKKLQDIPIEELTPETQKMLMEVVQKQLTERSNN